MENNNYENNNRNRMPEEPDNRNSNKNNGNGGNNNNKGNGSGGFWTFLLMGSIFLFLIFTMFRTLIPSDMNVIEYSEFVRMIESGEYPIDITNQIIYFAGPTPAKEGQAIGSCGPTTSCRMDSYSPKLIKDGLTGMIGKGERNSEVVDAIKTHKAVYFGAIGGCGALIAKCVKSSKVVAYDDLGTEAIRQLTVENFPAVVVIDSNGNKI